MIFNRRKFLMGIGGAVVGLPFLEGLAPKNARADNSFPPFAVFYRRANGVQQAMFNRVANAEPERWWPGPTYAGLPVPPEAAYGTAVPYGPLAAGALAASSSGIATLSDYESKLTIVRGLSHPVGTQNGHREGWIQGLTGAGVKYPNNVPDAFNCDPLGESLDNRICRELTPLSPNSIYLGLGAHAQGAVSYINQQDATGKQIARAADENVVNLYNRIFLPAQSDAAAAALLQGRRKSVNDLVRADLVALRSDPRLSASDRARLQLHTDAIRDVEQVLTCAVPASFQTDCANYQNGYGNNYDNGDYYLGNSVSSFGSICAELIALAIVCGVTRSVLISAGEAQDLIPYYPLIGWPGTTGPDVMGMYANGIDFHSVSHRQSVDGNPMTDIPNAQLFHHKVDVLHLSLFKQVLDALAAVPADGANTLLDKGVCVHYSDLGSGQHEITQLPYLYVGGAVGGPQPLKVGQFVDATNGGANAAYVAQFLNTIGAAVGCKNAAGNPLDDFNASNNGNITGRIASLIA
jgi:hypothetical protein